MLDMVYRRAARFRRKYGLQVPTTEAMIDRMVEAERLVIVPEFPLVGRVKEIVTGRYIFIQAGLDVGWRKWVKVHALYHKRYHAGNQLYLDTLEPVLKQRQERQANAFTGFVLLGNVLTWVCQGMTMAEVAEQAEVPEDALRLWWQIVEDWTKAVEQYG